MATQPVLSQTPPLKEEIKKTYTTPAHKVGNWVNFTFHVCFIFEFFIKL